MKRTTCLHIVCMLVFLALCFPVMTSAIGYENYKTYDVSESEAQDFLQRIQLVQSDIETIGTAFSSFAVSKQGQIALCFNGDNAAINVYDSEGIFLYGFRYINGNSAQAIFFEGETLSIIWGKSGYIGSFDAEGNCVNFRKDAQTKSNADAYHNDRYRPSSGLVGDKQYFVDKILLSPNYTRFVIEDDSGNDIVVYDASKEAYTSLAVMCLLAPILPAFVIYSIRQKKKDEQSDTQ